MFTPTHKTLKTSAAMLVTALIGLSPIHVALAGSNPSAQLLTTMGTLVFSGLTGGGLGAAGMASNTRQQYLQANATALLGDISIGGGESLTELATLYGLAQTDQPQLAMMMRTHRKTIKPLLHHIHTKHALNQMDELLLQYVKTIKQSS